MELAKKFEDVDVGSRNPAEVTVKRFMPVGNVQGTGSIEISAYEVLIPSRGMLFQGVRFEISDGQEYSNPGIVTVSSENAGKLLKAIEAIASFTISSANFVQSEIEAIVDGLRVVAFNTNRGDMSAVDADGVTCHFYKQSDLSEIGRIAKLAIDHLDQFGSMEK